LIEWSAFVGIFVNKLMIEVAKPMKLLTASRLWELAIPKDQRVLSDPS